MHFAAPSSLSRAAVGYSFAAGFFALSPLLVDRAQRKTLHTLQLQSKQFAITRST